MQTQPIKPVQRPQQRPCVLVFAGHDPSGGAGIQADIEAVTAQGAHALPIITALTVQDNNRVYQVHPIDADIIEAQARALFAAMPIHAVKLGIVGSARNAQRIAELIKELQEERIKAGNKASASIADADTQIAMTRSLDVVLDPVLASGAGQRLAIDEACAAIQPLLEVATLITPNLPELSRLASFGSGVAQKAQSLLGGACQDVLVKGGHSEEDAVTNRWFSQAFPHTEKQWTWPRLAGSFHGSGCTLASAIAAQLALGRSLEVSLLRGQSYTQAALQGAYRIADGQLMPHRFRSV
ncbi:hydroxymethylpyrimidine/phosphomethylpyrimidine kinase [Undibacterium cyanobacteriorum]|uniref:hydroxymethylpyrimidine kinase n=1 Tax=Undibacterium cyanobacteriorum TaxID=3073561 RepID=A0ABY9RIS6_9BURK|nr:hydroxymethylpyrimidine/phosphomethylpyrimidine kinase [Undibacterium sp. 20NA77.5]WMW80185.1 hydroxymethylpyrimidine/phosphomethylpyrimidine kinase [Undibacterium sp. 20NA77.5]